MQRTIGTTAVVDPGPEPVAADPPARPVPRRSRRADPSAIAVVVVGAAVRLAWLAYARPEPVSDFRHHQHLAYALLDTATFGIGQPSAWRLPAYPVVLAAGAVVSRDPLALAAVTVGLAVAQVALTWWVARRIFGSRAAATAAAAAAACAPALVAFAPVLASEHLLVVCVLAAIGVAVGRHPAVRPTGPTGRTALVAGLLLGAGALARGEALAYLPVIALVVALRRWRATGHVARAAGAAGLVLVGATLVVAPWVVRNEQVVGRGAGLSTTSGFNFLIAHSPGGYGWRRPLPPALTVADEAARNRAAWSTGLRYARDHPRHWLPAIRRGTRALVGPSTYAVHYATVARDPTSGRLAVRDDLALRGPALVLAGHGSQVLLGAGLLGLALIGVWRRTGWAVVVGIAVANWVLYAVVFWAQARYRFVVDAVACISVGAVPAVIGRLRVR